MLITVFTCLTPFTAVLEADRFRNFPIVWSVRTCMHVLLLMDQPA